MSEENDEAALSRQEGKSNSNNHLYAEDHFWTHNISNLEAGGLKLQKTTVGAAPVRIRKLRLTKIGQ